MLDGGNKDEFVIATGAFYDGLCIAIKREGVIPEIVRLTERVVISKGSLRETPWECRIVTVFLPFEMSILIALFFSHIR